MKENIRELIIVTLGILIAFGLNSWNEERKEKIESQKYLQGIKTEVSFNLEEMKKAVPYHKELLRTLKDNPSKANLVLNAPHLQNISWKLAKNQIFRSHTDPELYRKIATCYQLNEYIIQIGQNASERMSEVNILSPYYLIGTVKDDLTEQDYENFRVLRKKSWIPIFESWTAFEERYLKELEDLVKELD